MKVVFIAIPTSGTVRDGKLTEEFNKTLAQLHVDYPDCVFVTPMVQDYQMLSHMPDTGANWEVWGARCRALIPRCDEVWVLKFPGWDKSIGVAGEIMHANDCGIPILYVSV